MEITAQRNSHFFWSLVKIIAPKEIPRPTPPVRWCLANPTKIMGKTTIPTVTTGFWWTLAGIFGSNSKNTKIIGDFFRWNPRLILSFRLFWLWGGDLALWRAINLVSCRENTRMIKPQHLQGRPTLPVINGVKNSRLIKWVSVGL